MLAPWDGSEMNILVIGGGGREHALAWKLKQSPRVAQLFCAPGNAGMAGIAECVPADVNDPAGLAALAERVNADPAGLAALAERVNADLAVVGPELPLVQGVADEFATRGLKVVGPTRAAAELEGSKVFAKQFMQRHHIPTGEFTTCADHGDAWRRANWGRRARASSLRSILRGKSCPLSSSPMARPSCPVHLPATTSALSTATRGPTPAAWGLTPTMPWPMPPCASAYSKKLSAPPCPGRCRPA
jgi:hypothetical protein